MATKGGSKIFWIIGGLIVVAGSVGAYFLLRKPREEGGNEDGEVDSDSGSDSVSDSGSGSGGTTYNAPSELNDSTKIKAFQDWLDANKNCWLYDSSDKKYKNLSKNVGDCNRNAGGKGYGNYGKNTQIAWDKFGKEYLSKKEVTTTPTPTPKPTPSSSSISKDIDTIVGYSTGNKSQKIYLSKANVNFVKDWAKAIRNNRSAFVWANQVYRTKTGDKVLEYNPIGVKFYAKKGGAIAKSEPNASSSAYNVKKGINLGKASSIHFSNGLWLYLPDESSAFKWYKIDDVSKTNFSSFSGTTEQIEFSTFDNNRDLNL